MTNENISDRLTWKSNLDDIAKAIQEPFIVEARDMPKLFTISYQNDYERMKKDEGYSCNSLPRAIFLSKVRDALPIEDKELIGKLNEMCSLQFGHYNAKKYYEISDAIRNSPRDYWQIRNKARESAETVIDATEKVYANLKHYKPNKMSAKRWFGQVSKYGIHCFRNNNQHLYGIFFEERCKRV